MNMNKNIEFLENLLATFNNEDLKKNITEILTVMKKAEVQKEAEEALAIVEKKKKPKDFEKIMEIVRDFFYEIEIEAISDADLNEDSRRDLNQYIRNKINDSYQYTLALDNTKVHHWEYTISFYLDECPCGTLLHIAIENYRPNSKLKAVGAPHEMFYILIDFDKEGSVRKVDTQTTTEYHFNDWDYHIYNHEIKGLLDSLIYAIIDSDTEVKQKTNCDELMELHI